jgi:protein tyrosine phosphatase
MALQTKLPIIDLEWSSDGDFVLRNGDLADTKISKGRGFIQEVEDRVKSSTNDWKLLPRRGANIEEFHGEVNNQKTWKSIEAAISFSLVKDGFLEQQDFIVTAAPLSNTEVAVRIDFNASLTDTVPDSKIVVKVAYDLAGQGPFMVR